MIDILYSVIGTPFKKWALEKMEERDQYHREKLGLEVELEPEIARVIRSSGHVTTMKGNSANMLKIGVKRKRTKAEMDAAKLE